jgi:hypothetical protein
MPKLFDTIEGHRVEEHRRCPRLIVEERTWRLLSGELAAGRAVLLGLWADAAAVHMAVLDQNQIDVLVVSLECKDGRFPSVGALHPPAIVSVL